MMPNIIIRNLNLNVGIKKIITSIALATFCIAAIAQEDQIEDLLNETVINENPVYKPVISLGSGVLNFHGDVRNNYMNPLIGNYGFKINISTFLDLNRYFKANFFLIYGQLSANHRSLIDFERNLNFKTDLVDFGINLEYTFDHLFKKRNFIRPFISLGMENIQFTPKGDFLDASKNPYYYWTDGTIRNIDEAQIDLEPNSILHRDFNYETDLREREKTLYGLGVYSQNSFSIPLDAGFDFHVSDRVSARLGTSLHFTFTDYLDNVSSKGTHIVGKKGNDIFSYNYFMVRFDLFSQPQTQLIEKLFAQMEFDDVMFDDEDGDYILDAVDNCPGTPFGVLVDTSGCPLDKDYDGVPDYLDEEPNTLKNAWVDEKGKTLTEEQFLANILKRSDAMNREDVKQYLETIGHGYIRKLVVEIPDKFKPLDTDKDGYISFDELLKVIDNYFDNKLKFRAEDIYELNNFFFQQ